MWVHVYSGLTSRCITLVHAYQLIKAGGGYKKLVIIWPLEDVCNIHFREVFADDMFGDIKLKIIEINDKRYFDCHKSEGVRLNIKKKHYGKAITAALLIFMDLMRGTKKKIPSLVFGKNFFDYTPSEWSGEKHREHLKNTWNQVQKALLDHKKIYIKAYCGIIKENQWEYDLSVIKFRDEYWKRVNEILDPNEEYIGIHIRRTDHKAAINSSTTDSFIQQIDRVIKEQDGIRFFLATDDIQEEERLKEIYGNRIVVQTDKKWGRASSSEMKSGIIDCLCLSKCKYILGSYSSVFSNFASRYGQIKLITCKEQEGS